MSFMPAMVLFLASWTPLSCQAYYSPLQSRIEYKGREVLDPKGRYILEWSSNRETKTITFNITCNTTGWVGLGLSKKGDMEKADILISGVRTNGQPYAADMFAGYDRKLYSDTRQDWVLLSASESSGVTRLTVTRAWDTCDPYDYPITTDLLSVIWAFGETDTVEYHFDKRGSFRVYLLDPILKPPGRDLQIWELHDTITMPNRTTAYICTVHRAPVLSTKHHIVKIKQHLQNEQAVEHVHHTLLWRCVAPPGMPENMFEPLVGFPGEECHFNSHHVIPVLLCKMLITVWAIGGKELVLPYEVGFPLGESEFEYFMMETHFDNPLSYNGITLTTGLDLSLTSELRANDGGTMFLASHDTFGLFIVPPISPKFEIYGFCSVNCTRTMFPEEGVEVLAVKLHAHLSAKKIKLQLFRNGILDVIVKDDNYDPRFQQYRVLYEPRLVLPGDQLIITCEYDNTWTNMATVAGFSTREEMCIATVVLNKRLPFFVCDSQIPQETLLPLIGIEHVEWDVESQKRVITAPPHLAGKPLSYVTDETLNWTKDLRYRIQEISLYSTQIATCPEILVPPQVQGSQMTSDPETLRGYMISDSEDPGNILSIAGTYGKETLMGTESVPTRTPGPISFARFPFGSGRVVSRTCSREQVPFLSYLG